MAGGTQGWGWLDVAMAKTWQLSPAGTPKSTEVKIHGFGEKTLRPKHAKAAAGSPEHHGWAGAGAKSGFGDGFAGCSGSQAHPRHWGTTAVHTPNPYLQFVFIFISTFL